MIFCFMIFRSVSQSPIAIEVFVGVSPSLNRLKKTVSLSIPQCDTPSKEDSDAFNSGRSEKFEMPF